MKELFILNQQPSIADQFLAELRDVRVQHDSMRFRNNLRRLGHLIAYEISKELDYTEKTINTPLAQANVKTLENQPILMTILRAGLPYYEGFRDVFDKSYSGFIGAYRRANEEAPDGFDIYLGYSAFPDITDKEIIVVDPMLATGASLCKSLNKVLEFGTPKMIHISATLAAPEGVEYLKKELNAPFKLWLCALDEKLNEKAYIYPGLGDAGDLAFGEKL
ncbi:uracil phosphoribosyltransferase [Aureibacter tunicatorum]|uniref:Uracil phosphoribosyltransferase n=1 Tax=Aureibacter tunicatorum TaxID=866807 RepID=A0AAE3XQR8_9BACT|nr:uracil phosphoribosyltransferase [Aureibacter tunicatorum]MDR6240225.1 uracil phosphoribosyltransferase [Aureibacter tunicatorum]BDD05894.1 uracil phosphoribosyltransferase [Aureibacter tunicatorum]